MPSGSTAHFWPSASSANVGLIGSSGAGGSRPAPRRRRGRRAAGRGCGGRRQHRPGARLVLRERGRGGRPAGLVGLARDVLRLLARRQRRGEELGVVAARLLGRGDPVREGPQQVGAQRQAAGRQQLRQRQLAGQQRAPLGLPLRSRDVGDDAAGRGPGQQHPRLLEGLPHGGADQLPGGGLVAAPGARPVGRAGADPVEVGPTVARVDPAADVGGHPAGERHAAGAPLQVHLDAVGTVPQQEHGGRLARLRGGLPVGHGGQRSSTVSSTSTGAPSGSSATPTADRACSPSLPNTLPMSSEAPLMTRG